MSGGLGFGAPPIISDDIFGDARDVHVHLGSRGWHTEDDECDRDSSPMLDNYTLLLDLFPLSEIFDGLRLDGGYADDYGYGVGGGCGGGGGGGGSNDRDVANCSFKSDIQDFVTIPRGHDYILNTEKFDIGSENVKDRVEVEQCTAKTIDHQAPDIDGRLHPDIGPPNLQKDSVEVKIEPTELRIRQPPIIKPERKSPDVENLQCCPSESRGPREEPDAYARKPALCEDEGRGCSGAISSDDDDDDSGDEREEAFQGPSDYSKLPKSLRVPGGTPDGGPKGIRVPETSPKLACPYLKFDSKTYGQRPSCCGRSFATTHRLKEHLYRVHRQKPNCDRCRKIFSTEEDVKQHRRSKDSCELVEGVVVEGFDAAQKEKLQSKKRTRSKSEEEKWRDIFQILFPNCREVPDPYYYNPYFDAGVGDPALAPRDVEKIFTDDFQEQLCDGIERAIGTPLSQEKRRNVIDAVMKTLRQDRTTAKDDSSKATAEIPEGEQDDASPESSDPDVRPSEPVRSAHEARTTKPPGVLSEEDHRKRTRQILNEPARPRRLVKESEWPSSELRDFNFGEELDRWTGSMEDGVGCDWFRSVENSGFQIPMDDFVGEQYGGGLVFQNDVDGSCMGGNW